MATAKRKSEDQLLAVQPSGIYRFVENSYGGIKDGLDGATFDFVHTDQIGMYVDDEGMLKEMEFNVPASIFMARALWGPVVLTSAQTDGDGDTLPATKQAVMGFMAIARLWQQVLADADRLNQVVMTNANESTIPPATITTLDDAAFERFLTTGRFDAPNS